MNCASPCLTSQPTNCLSHTPPSQRFIQLLQHWRINWRTRRQLAQLDNYQLKDIGVSHGAAAEEATKPFWKD